MSTLETNSTIDVAVIGAGPTGLMLAGELAMRGLRVQILERRAQEPKITRAFAVDARTLELLDARGLADEVLTRGFPVGEVAPVPGATVSLADELQVRYPFILMVPQSGTEHVLTARAQRLGVRISRGAELTGLEQDAEGVRLTLAGGGGLRARYVVGCDGAHSAVRRLLGVDFVGKQYQTHIMLADVQLTRPPAERMFARTNAEGVVLVLPFGDGWYRAIAWDRRRKNEPLTEPVTAAQIRDALVRIAGEDFGLREMRWSSGFLSERRQARHYRVGRVLLAGDAAHVHSPIGGQGMNTGIGDAMNLGWKLALVVNGVATGAVSEALLDSYESERHPVGADVLAMTDMLNQLVLGRSALRRVLQRFIVRTILRVPRSRRMAAERLTGVAIAYTGGAADARRRLRRHPPLRGVAQWPLRPAQLRTRRPRLARCRPGKPLRRDATGRNPGPAGRLCRVGDTPGAHRRRTRRGAHPLVRRNPDWFRAADHAGTRRTTAVPGLTGRLTGEPGGYR